MDTASPPPNPPLDPSAPPFQTPNAALLQTIFQHLPGIVVVLTTDGIVLYSNPATTRITGYPERDLIGKNFWATLFPGRLFAQVPKFISAIQPLEILAQDVPMALRTITGQERVVAWSRITERVPAEANEAGREVIICFGTDLTDRLNAADNQSIAGNPNATAGPTAGTAASTAAKGAGAAGESGARGGTKGGDADSTFVPFGPGVGNAGSIDGEIVVPIAISPPLLPGEPRGGVGAIQQVHEFLVGIDERIEALETAFTLGELANVAGIAAGLRTGAHACGLLEFSTRAEQLQSAAARGAMDQVSQLVQEMVAMVKPDREAE